MTTSKESMNAQKKLAAALANVNKLSREVVTQERSDIVAHASKGIDAVLSSNRLDSLVEYSNSVIKQEDARALARAMFVGGVAESMVSNAVSVLIDRGCKPEWLLAPNKDVRKRATEPAQEAAKVHVDTRAFCEDISAISCLTDTQLVSWRAVKGKPQDNGEILACTPTELDQHKSVFSDKLDADGNIDIRGANAFVCDGVTRIRRALDTKVNPKPKKGANARSTPADRVINEIAALVELSTKDSWNVSAKVTRKLKELFEEIKAAGGDAKSIAAK